MKIGEYVRMPLYTGPDHSIIYPGTVTHISPHGWYQVTFSINGAFVRECYFMGRKQTNDDKGIFKSDLGSASED